MPRALILVLIRLFVLAALAASSALMFDYRGGAAAFCAVGEGCDKIKESTWASIAGIPTPILGVLAFVALYALTLLPHPRRKQLMVPAALIGALGGIGFLLIQALVEHAFCKLCVVVDVSSIAAAAAAIVYRARGDAGDDGRLSQGAWGALAALAIAAPLVFGKMQPEPEVKAAISRYWVAGKVNIVEMSDFECAFCRIQHPSTHEVLATYGDRVNFVRLTVPLGGHPNARPASRAYLCARDMGKGEPMAHALFTEELSEGSVDRTVRQLAAQHGLDLAALQRCMSDPKTDARVTEDYNRARDQIGFRGLPTMWVGSQVIEGARGAEALRRAIESQLEGGKSLRPTVSAAWLWSGLVAVLLGAGAWALRKRA